MNKTMIRKIESMLKNSQHDARGAWMTNGKQCFTTGYAAYRVNEPLPLPEIAPIKAIDSMFENQYSSEFVVDIDILKQCKKQNRDSLCRLGLVVLNVGKLLDMINITGAKNGTVYVNSDSKYSPVYVYGDNGDGLLCQVNPSRNAAIAAVFADKTGNDFNNEWQNFRK